MRTASALGDFVLICHLHDLPITIYLAELSVIANEELHRENNEKRTDAEVPGYPPAIYCNLKNFRLVAQCSREWRTIIVLV
jgi:hypothetical protein